MIVSFNGTKRFLWWHGKYFGGFIQHEVMLRACFERDMVIIVSALIFFINYALKV